MRMLAFILLASFGVAGTVLPCAAQSTIVTGPQSITVAKQATPERLAPPQAETASPPVQVLTTKPTPLPVSPPGNEAYAPQSQAYAPPEKPMPAASSPAQASPDLQGSFTTAERLMDWISNYRKHPNPSRVPAAVHAMEDYGLLRDEEKAWFSTGFIAGVLGSNPKDGPALIPRMFPLPDKEQARSA
jgi:hypothetical protein